MKVAVDTTSLPESWQVALRFVIAAVTDAGTSLISVDPAAGSFDADVTVPAVPSRFGDFSGAEFRVIDLATRHQVALLRRRGVEVVQVSPLDVRPRWGWRSELDANREGA